MATRRTSTDDTVTMPDDNDSDHDGASVTEVLATTGEQPLLTDWHDEHHDHMRVTVCDSDGKLLQTQVYDAPVNKNAAYPVFVVFEIAHPDGCSKVLLRVPLPVF